MRCKGDWHAFHIAAYTCECRRYEVTVEPTQKAEPTPYLGGYHDGYAKRDPVTNNEVYMRGHEIGAWVRKAQGR